MTPAILRTVLAVAFVLAIGVWANIFANQQSTLHAQTAGVPATGLAATETTRTTATLSREAEAQHLFDGIRRQLVDRGYLSTSLSAAAVPGALPIAAAIVAFEYDYALPLTATATDGVLKVLIFTYAKSTTKSDGSVTTPYAGSLIMEVQRALAHLGYGSGEPTGQLDAETKAAIAKFERARGLQVSGRISAPLIESLGPALNRTALETTSVTAAADDAG